MATPTATPSDRIEEQDGDVTYVRTDKDLPPVAIIDRSVEAAMRVETGNSFPRDHRASGAR